MNNRITVTQAASMLQCSPMFVRLAMREGKLPIGIAMKTSSRWTYLIYEDKVKAYMSGAVRA